MPDEPRTEAFDYQLPEDLIAQEPLARRDESRLLVLRRDLPPGEGLEHRRFSDLPAYLKAGDCLVLNDTRVMAARLTGEKVPGGARAEVLLLGPSSRSHWRALLRRRRRFPPGTELILAEGRLRARVVEFLPSGQALLEMEAPEGEVFSLMRSRGEVPLPPYVHRSLDDSERYQTVYAAEEGSVAAPTAGLHFTPGLLQTIQELGIRVARVTLHVGPGTFQPVRVERPREHRMHRESFRVPPEAAELVNSSRAAGGRVVAAGTTVVRTLEAACDQEGRLRPGAGETDLFIYPGYRFRCVGVMITNFHLPRSTLLMLVSALAGRERIMAAYREAIRERYRFYSFGDAMLIL